MANKPGKPRLTKRVLRGLASIRAAVETAPDEVVFGIDYEDLDTEQKKEYADLEKALNWINEMQLYAEAKKGA